MDLYDFCYMGDYSSVINNLASFTDEKWSYGDSEDLSVLKNYIKYTFRKLHEDGYIVANEKYCIFNTGLFTKYNEPIFFYAEKNTNQNAQPWFFKGFFTDYELGERSITDRPARANYFKDTSLLVFDTNCPINVQYKHILEDKENFKRFPINLQNNLSLRIILEGAISDVKKKVMSNYRIAIPQYFNGKIQLLLPLCLEKPDRVDLALVVTKNIGGNYYQGHTCLTLEMAYNNARLISRQTDNWLLV